MTTRLGYPTLTTSTLNLEASINEALFRFDVAACPQINSRTVVTPPLAPAEGDVYIVPVGASVAWGAPDNYVMYRFGGFWYSFLPNRRLYLTVADEADQRIFWSGTAWVNTASSGGGHAIADEGTLVPSQPTLNFVGPGVTVTDDAINSRTIVTIPGGGSSGGGGGGGSSLTWSAPSGVAALAPNGGYLLNSTNLSHSIEAGTLGAIVEIVGTAGWKAGGNPNVIFAADGTSMNGCQSMPGFPRAVASLRCLGGSNWSLFNSTGVELAAVIGGGPTSDYYFPPTPYSYFAAKRNTNYGTFDSSMQATISVGSGYRGGVLLTDGRVFCVPNDATTAKIYDPVTTTTTVAGGSFPGAGAYLGGVLLPDGRVFCVPLQTTTARIYDPVTNTTTVAGGSFPGGGAYVGGVLLPDGQVFCVPHHATTARIYDPVTNTTTVAGGSFPGGGAHIGGVLLPDGRVFCVPYQASTARIYDPVTNTTTVAGGSFPGGASYWGGVLLPDGRVFCVPHQATTAIIYDPVTNTTTVAVGSFPGGGAYVGGVLLPDGRVFCVPHNASTATIYDPATNTTAAGGSFPGSSAYTGGVLLPDGRVFCVPDPAPNATVVGGVLPTLPISRTMSAYDNKL